MLQVQVENPEQADPAALPAGKKMVHAGAIVMGDRGTHASKKAALEAAGVRVLDMPSQVGEALRDALAR